MAEQKNKAPISIKIGEESCGFKVPGHAEIKFYYDTGSESLYDASRNLIIACALEPMEIRKLIDAKPALVPQIAVNLMRVAGTGMEVKLENFPKSADAS